jgi:amidase
MMTSEAYLPAWALLHQLRRGETTSRALLERMLERVALVNPGINAIILLDAERARAAADAADAALARGEPLGTLHGLPMTVKETNNVAGWPTTFGDPACRDEVPTRSAEIIRRLEAAGAVIFGKTNVPLNALDWQSYNAIHGTTRNPWKLTHSPGGSSGGSAAALATGLTPLELGSDAGGSIRIPAAFCGVFGHKPTPDLVPGDGNGRPGSLLGNDLVTSGPLARSVKDLSLALDVLAGPAGERAKAWRLQLPPARATQAREFRVALLETSPVAEVAEEYRAAIRTLGEKLRGIGANVSLNVLPFTDHAAHHAAYVQLLRGSAVARLPEPAFSAAIAETEQVASNATPYVRQMSAAYAQRHRAWLQSEEYRARLKRDWASFFEEFDVLVAPAAMGPAFPLDEARPREERTLRINGRDADYNDTLFWAGIATLPSLPATTAPIGFTADGLPLGVQVLGPAWEDRTTLAFAGVLEALMPFSPPPGFG